MVLDGEDRKNEECVGIGVDKVCINSAVLLSFIVYFRLRLACDGFTFSHFCVLLMTILLGKSSFMIPQLMNGRKSGC